MEQERVKDKRQAGWFWMNNSLIDEYGQAIGASGVAIYAVLARCANQDRHASPSVRYMARHLGLHTNTVMKYLEVLEDQRLITIKRRRSSAGDKDTTEYILLTPETKEPQVGVSSSETPKKKQMVSSVNTMSLSAEVSEPVRHRVLTSETHNNPEVSHPVRQVSESVRQVSQILEGGVSSSETFEDLRNKKENPNPPTPLTKGEHVNEGEAKAKRKREGTGKVVQAKATAILKYFNDVHGRAYESASQIEALLRSTKLQEPTLEDCKLVIDYLYLVERLDNEDGYRKYVDNITPWRPSNFERHRERAREWDRDGRLPYQSRTLTNSSTNAARRIQDAARAATPVHGPRGQ